MIVRWFYVGAFLFGLVGCQRELDMAKAYDNRSAATTIRYIGVRGGARQFPDYSVIRETILTEPAPGTAPKGKAERSP